MTTGKAQERRHTPPGFSSRAWRDDNRNMSQHDPPAASGERITGPDGRDGERRGPTAERRSGADRRSGLDRRRGPGRRRTDYRRAAEEGHMNEEQVDFLRAVDEYKRVNDRAFPTLTEILDLVLYLGYRRVAPVGEFKLCKGRQTPLRRARDDPDDA